MTHPKVVDTTYTPTASELTGIESYEKRLAKRKPSPRLKLKMLNDNKGNLIFDHPNPAVAEKLFKESLATVDNDLVFGLVNQVAKTTSLDNQPDESGINMTLSMIRAIQPRDELETMLATQMAAIHNATMDFAKRLTTVDNLAQQDSASNALNKLARTFTIQIEALKRYRSTGEQKMTVQHVTVNDGGQAVIGDVSRGEANKKSEDKPHAKHLTHAPSQTLQSQIEAVGEAVPSPRR